MTPFAARLAILPAALLGALLMLAGCDSTAGTDSTADVSTSSDAGVSAGVDGSASLPATPTTRTTSYSSSHPAAPPVPASALDAIKTAVNRINHTAGGPIADQRAVLDQLAAPDERARQHDCPTATTTLAFDPAYEDLRSVPEGDVNEYLLPTYISIYTGRRITGSDLATLHWWVTDGAAHTTALCVS